MEGDVIEHEGEIYHLRYEPDPRIRPEPEINPAIVGQGPIAARQEALRKARVQNYFNRQDDFWAFREWPLWVQEIALQKHKRYRERYRFFLFLTFNGLNPLTARMWLIMNDYRQGHFIEEDYDRSAWSQIDQMVRDAFSKDLFRKKQARMFDMILGRPD